MLYEAAENAGVRFPSSTYTPFVDKLSTKLMREGLDDVLYPKVSAASTGSCRSRSTEIPASWIWKPFAGSSAMQRSRLTQRSGRLAQIGIDAVDDFVEAGDSATSSVMKEARADVVARCVSRS